MKGIKFNDIVVDFPSGGGIKIEDLPKFVNKIYVDMSKSTSLNGLFRLSCVESSNFVVVFPDGTSQEYAEPTTLIEHQFTEASQAGWVYFYGDWKGVDVSEMSVTERKTIIEVIYDTNITTIPKNAFSSCSNLMRIDLPNTVTSIGEYAFGSCSSLKKFIIPDSVVSTGQRVLQGCTSLRSICIGAGLTTLAQRFAYGCTSLYSIKIPEKTQTISPSSFGGCTSLTTIEFMPSSKYSSIQSSFENCSSLKKIVLGDLFNGIVGGDAFQNCTSIEEFVLKGNFFVKLTYPISVQPTTFFVKSKFLKDYKTATNWTTHADRFYPIGGNYSETITIPSTAWDSSTNTVTVEAVGATTEARNIITWFTSSGGSQVENTYDLKCTAQGTMSLTFSCETIPTEDIEVSVSYMLTNY